MKRIAIGALIIVVLLGAGCKNETPDPNQGQAAGLRGAKDPLRLYCAAGIRPAVAELIEIFRDEYGVEVSPDYAGSEVLLSKIRLVQSGDLYLPGDKHYVDQAADHGMIASRRPLAYWVPTILVAKGNPKGIRGLSDLLRPGVKVGFGDPEACAIGRTTHLILEKNKITWDRIKPHVVFQSLTVNELGMQIQAGALDAVIVWDAMGHYFAEHGEMVPIPADNNVFSTIDVGVLQFTKKRALAEEFMEFMTSPRAREVFAKHKYRAEPPE